MNRPSYGWDLPPGVSMGDPHIAGPDEGTMEVECGEEGVDVIFDHPVSEAIELVQEDTRPADVRLAWFIDRLAEAASTTATCDFEGEVDVVWSDRTTYTWTCPYCGTDHEGEIDTGPDPDDLRDLARDMAEDD